MEQLAIKGGNPIWNKGWPSWPVWDQAERDAVSDVLESGRWQASKHVRQFEAAFSAYHQAKQGICVTNGTASMEVALRALGVGHGDEVIVPAYTFAATGLAVLTVGATPIFADVDKWLNLDPKQVEALITPQTKAMIPVHVGGISANMDGLLAIAKKQNLAVIEDAAHAHGSEWAGKRLGALGDVGSFSFQTGKCMTSGDGGILLCNDEQLAKKLRLYREFGRVSTEHGLDYLVAGSNERLSEFQAAILECQLARLDEQIALRRQAVDKLTALLGEIPGVRIEPLDSRVTRWSVYILPIWLDLGSFSGLSKGTIVDAIKAEGIPLETGYPSLTEVTVFKDLLSAGKCSAGPVPVTKQATRQVVWLSFPVFMNGMEAIEAVAAAFCKVQKLAGTLGEVQDF